MQPGDIYAPPPGSQPRRGDPYDPYASTAQNQQHPPPVPPAPGQYGHQHTASNSNPFDEPPSRYDSPAPVPPPVPPPPVGTLGLPQPYEAGHSESQVSLNQPYLPDTRLHSPPPLHQMNSAYGDLGYPPTPAPYHGTQEDDYNDHAPLLNQPGQPGGYGMPAYQLTDEGAIPMTQVHGHGYAPPLPPQSGPPMTMQGIRFDDPYGDGPHGHGEDQPRIHYGPLPTRQIRRNKTQKRVQLFQGHLVLDVDVPSKLLEKCTIKEGNEFTKMRYTAVTCDPDDFVRDNYTLRQRLYNPPRHTELFIVVTMYNEDDTLFARTMYGIMQNIANLCNRGSKSTWSKEGWQKVVVCIVSDGRMKINPRTRSVLAALGVYQDGIGTNVVNGKPVTAHLYEYTTQLYINKDGSIVGAASKRAGKVVPVQLLFCLKEKNQKKINSHRWFFNAFGQALNPNVCVLLDVGTQPGPDSIYHLWKAFDINSACGGACGEIVALKGKLWHNLINPLVAAQNFEYKMSNILDKPLESVFGYITVLPGAFSAYRYIAIKNDPQTGEGPLQKYFLGETMHGAGAGIFKANMYLAEDRILCWELVSKRGSNWTLHYVKSAEGVTDVPDQVPELVSQRRRWLNGSFFAAIHSIVHFGYIYRSSHSFGRKLALHIELIYQILTNIFAWFSLGNYYIAFVVLTNSMTATGKAFHYVGVALNWFYLALLLLCFILALGNRPQGSKVGYTVAMIGYALITVYMIFCAVWLAVHSIQTVKDEAGGVNELLRSKVFTNIVLSLLATYGLYILSSLIAFDPWHLVTSFLQYLLIAPSFINVLNVYAFSNVHDVSWGTKGSDKVEQDLGVVKATEKKDEVEVELPEKDEDRNAVYLNELAIISTPAPKEVHVVNEEQKQEDYYKNFRSNVLLVWTMTNAALAIGILTGAGNQNLDDNKVASTYMAVLLYTVAGLAFFRFLGASLYMIIRLFMGE